MENLKTTLKNPVKALRKAQHLRQIDLAEHVNLAPRTISGLELGDCATMHTKTARKLATYFHVDVAQLMAEYVMWRAETALYQNES